MKKYRFGECIPESVKVYNRLKRQGYTPKLVEGWVEVSDWPGDLLPNREFFVLYYPDEIKKLNKDLNYDDYIRVIQHTWVICDGKIIDNTRNQFDIYGGILVYYEKMKYEPRGKAIANDITEWFDERDYIITRDKFIHYPDEIKIIIPSARTDNKKLFLKKVVSCCKTKR